MALWLQVWSEAGAGRRAGVVIGALLVLGLTALGFYWLLSDRQEVLFSGLETRDAAGIVRELERMKVDYQLTEGGTSILVPAEAVHRTRMKLMDAGVPLSGGVGFEIFDNSDFGMTEFAQRINLQRALEGELTRTIMALDEIKYARVHLVMPETGLFKQDTRDPTASVALFLKPGRELTPEKVLGIQRLVAAAVPDLTKEQVTVSDENGVTLSRIVSAENGVEAVSERLQKKAEVERYLVDKAIHVLEKAFGPNQALVSIDVTLDFSQSQVTREEVIPVSRGKTIEGVVRRRETRSADAQGDGGENVSTEIEYELGRAVEQIVQTPGQIRRMSVGVIVPDETRESRRDDIRRLVAMTIGVDEDRGDAIGVYSAAAPTVLQNPVAASATAATAEPVAAAPASGSTTAPVDAALSDTSVAAGADGWWADLQRNLPVSVLAAMAALTLAAAIAFLIGMQAWRRGTRAERQLTREERERVLSQIRNWIDMEPAATTEETPVARIAK